MKRIRFFSLILVIAMLISAFSVQFTAAGQDQPRGLTATALTPISVFSAGGSVKPVSIIVQLDDAPLATYAGTVPGLAATSPKLSGAEKLDANAPASQLYLDYLAEKQSDFEARVTQVAPAAQIVHRYRAAINGLSIVVQEDEVNAIAKLPGVKAIFRDEVRHIDTDASPAFIGAPRLWQKLGGQGSAGEGIVVGILDTGIWPEHPSFSDPDPAGKPYAAPPGGPYACEFGNTAWNPEDAAFTCNNKLIGAYEFMDTYKAVVGLDPAEFDSARDSDGHGSHTASTAAGNAGVEASIMGADLGIISGIAPRAHVIMYRVCGGPPNASCYSSDSAAAVEQAILDGADVLNFSIGGGSNPYSDAVSLAFLNAFEAGVFVAVSAGNSGPGADTVGHREPWTTTVAASTQARTFEGYVYVTADNGDTLDLVGVSITGGATGELVLGADYGDPLCGSEDGVNPFAPGTFTSDQIVVCERGIVARVEKSANIAAAGGGGMVMYNPTIATVNADNHFLPTVHIDDVAGVALLDFMAAHTGLMATLEGGVKAETQADVMAAFSSRGGPGQTLGISKPDISAPGVNILAGHTPLPAFPTLGLGAPGQYFQAIGGTSMSAPHIAGSAALMMALHPDWTPAQIKSALMTTAVTRGMTKEDAVTPVDAFDVGSGRVDLARAGDPGITFDESAANYLALEDELWQANYPSLFHPNMPGRITVQRTATDVTGSNRYWRLAASTDQGDWRIRVPRWLFVPAGGEATFDITVEAGLVPIGEFRFGEVYLTDGMHRLHMPVTFVRGEPGVSMVKSCDPAIFPAGDTTACTITLENTGFDDATVSVMDRLPRPLLVIPASVVGGDVFGNRVTFDGTLAAAQPPDVSVGVGASPFGYLALSAIGLTPNVTHSDESCANFAVPPFDYAGETYDVIGMVSNGYAVVGGCTGSADIDFINQILPDPTPPNNVLAPFWTDLNPSTGGSYYAYSLSDGVSTWLVFEWEEAPNWGDGELNSFQIWIGLDDVEEINFTYGEALSDGDGGFLTVGAENAYGSSGENYYADGVGTPPAFGTDVGVTSIPGAPGESHTITFEALGSAAGDWTNCAEMTGDLFFGTSLACFSGETHAP